MQGRKNYQPKLFTNFILSDYIPNDNFYKCLKKEIDLEFLRKETLRYYGRCGQKSIDPVVFFKLNLVGYLENINSDRKLIEHSSMRLDIRYFLDYDIDEELPWHSTLSRTRQLFDHDVFRNVFKKVLSMCIEKGMVAGRRQAIDSALIKANASMDSLKKQEIFNDLEKYTIEINKANTLIESEETITNNHQIGNSHYVKNINNLSYYSPSDPDAKVSFKPGKPRRLNYLSQVSVDTSNHVITHIQADFADKRDSECLPEVLDMVKKNLKSNDLEIEEIVCDGNYSSSDVLKNLDKNKISGFIPNFGGYKNKREDFTYNTSGDYYKCMQGKILPFKKFFFSKRGSYFKEYRSSTTDCSACPFKQKCIGKSNQKMIRDSADKAYFDKMHTKMKTNYGKYLLKVRKSTVEPVLGTLIEYGGLKKIRTKGLSLANKCMLMAGTAYNLKKWLKWIPRKIEIGVAEVKNEINYGLSLFIKIYSILNA